MQTQTPQTSEHERYLAAELDYVVVNFSITSTRFRRTLRRIAVLSLLALAANQQIPAQTAAGRALDELLFTVGKEWPKVTSTQLAAFVGWFADALDQFSLSESGLSDTFLDL